ncbi:hypothetical protein H9P43_007642 [Blastocladiella emersonii ATCC 22665]|nr:hypothetical protein H9P43_007642 [Blastocladiella emersonii ATCC 22665]
MPRTPIRTPMTFPPRPITPTPQLAASDRSSMPPPPVPARQYQQTASRAPPPTTLEPPPPQQLQPVPPASPTDTLASGTYLSMGTVTGPAAGTSPTKSPTRVPPQLARTMTQQSSFHSTHHQHRRNDSIQSSASVHTNASINFPPNLFPNSPTRQQQAANSSSAATSPGTAVHLAKRLFQETKAFFEMGDNPDPAAYASHHYVNRNNHGPEPVARESKLHAEIAALQRELKRIKGERDRLESALAESHPPPPRTTVLPWDAAAMVSKTNRMADRVAAAERLAASTSETVRTLHAERMAEQASSLAAHVTRTMQLESQLQWFGITPMTAAPAALDQVPDEWLRLNERRAALDAQTQIIDAEYAAFLVTAHELEAKRNSTFHQLAAAVSGMRVASPKNSIDELKELFKDHEPAPVVPPPDKTELRKAVEEYIKAQREAVKIKKEKAAAAAVAQPAAATAAGLGAAEQQQQPVPAAASAPAAATTAPAPVSALGFTAAPVSNTFQSSPPRSTAAAAAPVPALGNATATATDLAPSAPKPLPTVAAAAAVSPTVVETVRSTVRRKPPATLVALPDTRASSSSSSSVPTTAPAPSASAPAPAASVTSSTMAIAARALALEKARQAAAAAASGAAAGPATATRASVPSVEAVARKPLPPAPAPATLKVELAPAPAKKDAAAAVSPPSKPAEPTSPAPKPVAGASRELAASEPALVTTTSAAADPKPAVTGSASTLPPMLDLSFSSSLGLKPTSANHDSGITVPLLDDDMMGLLDMLS